MENIQKDQMQRARKVLGNRLTAYCLGYTDTASVAQIARGEALCADEDMQLRLCELDMVLDFLCEHEGDETIRAWMMGSGVQGEAPARWLREGKDVDSVMAAASSLVSCGFS